MRWLLLLLFLNGQHLLDDDNSIFRINRNGNKNIRGRVDGIIDDDNDDTDIGDIRMVLNAMVVNGGLVARTATITNTDVHCCMTDTRTTTITIYYSSRSTYQP